jgi:hypothetical protein
MADKNSFASAAERMESLTEATEEQCNAAFEKADEWMDHSGRLFYAHSCGRAAVAEYILYTQGLRAKRY